MNERLAVLTDRQLLALCLWGEARGEGVIGQLAVAHVVLNRLHTRTWYGATVRAVIAYPYQFSFFNQVPDPLPQPGPEQLAIAELVLGGHTVDPTLGATHYHAATVDPSWRQHLDFLIRIGNHLFYRE